MLPEEFAQMFNVPRGTMDKFHYFEKLLRLWQEKINLVGRGTLDDIWERHFADSAQLIHYTDSGKKWLDVGAGAGFPGMVLAILDWGEVTLVESIAKKCQFLGEVRDQLALANVRILRERVENLPAQQADIGTSRATASLSRLLEWIPRHVQDNGRLVFPKGKNWAKEVEEARESHNFDLETCPSVTNAEARILILRKWKKRQ